MIYGIFDGFLSWIIFNVQNACRASIANLSQNHCCCLSQRQQIPQCTSNQCGHYIWQEEAIKSKGIGLAQSRVKHLRTENLLVNTSEIIVSYVDK